MIDAFAPLCECTSTEKAHLAHAAHTAFSENWVKFSNSQTQLADDGRKRFLRRYVFPLGGLWETEEVVAELELMYRLKQKSDGHDEAAIDCEEEVDLSDPVVRDHDAAKPRATVEQYTAMICQEVSVNLEGIALARQERKPRMYQSDGAIHETYISTCIGGGAADNDDDYLESGDGGVGLQPVYPPPFINFVVILAIIRYHHEKPRACPDASFGQERGSDGGGWGKNE